MKSIQVSETASIYNDADIKALRERVVELEALLKRVDDEAMCVTAQLDSDIGAALAVSKRAGGEEDDD